MMKSFIAAIRSWNRARLAARRSLRKARFHTFGVLAIMKNESMNIDEWIEHYLWMGAGKIYLIDNGSTDDTVAKARVWEAKGCVELVEYPERHRQRQHYWKAFRHFGIASQCDKLLIADMDEFWFCPAGDSLASALKEFENFDVIYSHWVMFGSSGFVDHPTSVRESFNLRRPGTDAHTKYIFRTQVAKRSSAIGIHKFKGADSSRTIAGFERFQLNHYPIQSLDFFRSVKMTRGDACRASIDTMRDMDYFHRYDAGCTQADRQLADLVAAARKR